MKDAQSENRSEILPNKETDVFSVDLTEDFAEAVAESFAQSLAAELTDTLPAETETATETETEPETETATETETEPDAAAAFKERETAGSRSSNLADWELEESGNELRVVRYLGKGGNVRIPKGVTTLPKTLFQKVPELESIQFPFSLSHIPANPFAFCPKLKKVELSGSHPYFRMEGKVLFSQDGRTLIAFLDRDAGSYEIPKRVCEIAELAFGNCGKLRTLTFHKNVQKIGLGAFLNCSELLICAPKDSEALKCAKKRGIRHRAILDEPEESGILGALERSALGQSALGQWIREKFEEKD